jgi:hypothetical protein
MMPIVSSRSIMTHLTKQINAILAGDPDERRKLEWRDTSSAAILPWLGKREPPLRYALRCLLTISVKEQSGSTEYRGSDWSGRDTQYISKSKGHTRGRICKDRWTGNKSSKFQLIAHAMNANIIFK